MIFEEISYTLTAEIDNKNSEVYYVQAYLEDGDDPGVSYQDLKDFIESVRATDDGSDDDGD